MMAKPIKPIVPAIAARPPIRPKGVVDRAVRFRCALTNTILDVLRARGWTEVSGDESQWDLFWADVCWIKESFDHFFMEEHMRVNHFRNHYELTKKNLMNKNLKRLRKQVEKEQGKTESMKWDFFPMSYELPADYHMFVEEFKKYPGTIWIMKPAGRSQGKGIFLFSKLRDITEWKKGEYKPNSDKEKDGDKEPIETYVVQRYIDNPYLIAGRKFDLRIYAMVTTYIPMKAWLYRGGFARLTNTRFSMESLSDNYIHLTNVAVQKTSPDYDPEGCKWSMQQIRQYLTARHGVPAVETLFKNIDEIIIKSLHSVQKTMINNKHCFELYGYDVLIDSNLKPWLLEINASPSLTASNQDDYNLKFALLNDVLTIVDMENRLTGKEKRVGGFDLLWNDGPVVADFGNLENVNSKNFVANSFLGCVNDREQQLKQMFKKLELAQKSSQQSSSQS